ncbi:MAG: DUF4157 domain-containing protein [Zoogloea sp.]|nr:DUF4157 domain-containing protein [Zoogloea sp.]
MNRQLLRTAMLPVIRNRPAEQRADRVARGERPARSGRVARDAAPAGLSLGTGQPLPATERRYFERRLGADLAGVRIHPEAEAATSLGTNAFAAGRDIGFAPGRWQPGTAEGRRLLGHELAHVLEQGSRRQPTVQLEETAKPEDADKAAETLSEGVKTVLEQAKENEGVKSALLDPAKNYALRQWNPLGTAEKVGVAGFGAGTYGLALGAGLADPAGRKLLSDVNLVAPLGLIPYSTLTGFSYVLPATPGGATLFKASFSGDDLLGLAHQKVSWMPPMSLSLDFGWSVDPAGGVSLSSAKASWGVMPGVNLQIGSGVGPDWKPTLIGPDGQTTTVMKSLPAPAGATATPGGTGMFVTVDLLKAPFVPAPVRAALGGDTKGK